jgi:hypothetical protein
VLIALAVLSFVFRALQIVLFGDPMQTYRTAQGALAHYSSVLIAAAVAMLALAGAWLYRFLYTRGWRSSRLNRDLE